jgi:hypothetical protein
VGEGRKRRAVGKGEEDVNDQQVGAGDERVVSVPARAVPGPTGSTVEREGRTALAGDDVPLLGCHHDDLRLVNLLLGQAHVARQLPNLRRQGLAGRWMVGASVDSRPASSAACAATGSKQGTQAARRQRQERNALDLSLESRSPRRLTLTP